MESGSRSSTTAKLPYKHSALPSQTSQTSIDKQDSKDSEAKYAGSKIFALLIGIDKYKNEPTLSGCVNDCRDVKAWITEAFGSGDEVEVKLLLNGEATGDAIRQAILNLADDKRIMQDDLVLIYFAGHGSEIRPMKEWNLPSKRNLQMRIPYDFSRTECNHILDRELSQLLSKLTVARQEKCQNVVVILDSCHSASGTRDTGDIGTVRSIEVPDDYAVVASLFPSDFAPLAWANSSRAASTTPMDHVLLAACREDLKAREIFTAGNRRRGNFTYHLFRKLRTAGSESLTYEELILSLGTLNHQFPHCDGIDKDRIVFSLERKDRIFNAITQETTHYDLQMGLCHDVQAKEEFLVFEESDYSSVYRGKVEVLASQSFQSQLSVRQGMPPKAFAVRVVPHLAAQIFSFPPGIRASLAKFTWISSLGVQTAGLLDSESRDKIASKSERDKVADLEIICQEGNWVKFSFLRHQHNLAQTLFHPWPTNEIDWVRLLEHVGHLCHYLNRGVTREAPPVQVEIVTVKDGRAIDDPRRLDANGCCIEADDETEYGFKVTNTSNQPIFFSLFYFDMSKFAIDAVYNPPTVAGGEATPCLVAHESKTIGYGSEADEAFIFGFGDSQMDSDLGYLKMFYSDRYIDLLHVRREALFFREEELNDVRSMYKSSARRAQRYIPPSYMPTDPSTRYLEVLRFPIVQTKSTKQ